MSGMTSTEICDIIKACGESGVELLKYKGLHISFNEKPVVTEVPVYSYEPINVANSTQLPDNETNVPLEVDAEDLDEIMITDPSAWERTVNNGNLDV